ncbi:LysR family transcriptional regulator [Ochrobactrum haematophilum]|uniref:LysR family transcriptional regulator n=1 Tax=Brucella haematophila TaxID=419474 RepID=A0ABX1DR50_9HYPH|nr:LysR family transcriptional regulator [Brucella haematophila]
MSTQEKPPALNLRQLYYFLTLADHGSISAAADSLGMAQPSLSENIAKLERSLGVKLAIRGARGVELTEAGVALTARGKQILQMSESMVEGVQSIGTSTTGQVTVALPLP